MHYSLFLMHKINSLFKSLVSDCVLGATQLMAHHCLLAAGFASPCVFTQNSVLKGFRIISVLFIVVFFPL